MPKSKMVDRAEVIRWYEDGWTYKEMAEEYARKYNLVVAPSMFSNFRHRMGLERRSQRDDRLIPWEVMPQHRWAYPLAMLRVEARRRAGLSVREIDAERLASFKARLHEAGAVVHYDPDTDQGWWLVPRREGKDLDLIREPERKTTLRRNADV